jgi:signal transduction histidine kinase
VEELALTFMPYPHVLRGERRDGVRQHWLPRCDSCDRQCERDKTEEVKLCSYGLNYLWVDDDLLIAGVAIRDYPEKTTNSKKMLRRVRKDAITLRELSDVRDAGVKALVNLSEQLKSRQDEIVDEYRQSKLYKTEVVNLLKPDIQRALSQVHDYRQLITQIVQNVNVAVETQNPGVPFRQALSNSPHETQAIYWAARLMEKKLEAALYLMYPERITDPKKVTVFRLHGLLVKYARIYERSYAQRSINIVYEGTSYGEVYGNPDAIGVILHAYLDNAMKYSPSGENVVLSFSEDEGEINFECQSWGPRIHNSEKSDIFTLFVRGVEANAKVEGTGFGLGLAQHVANSTGITVDVLQSPNPIGPEGTHQTRFRAVFKRHR